MAEVTTTISEKTEDNVDETKTEDERKEEPKTVTQADVEAAAEKAAQSAADKVRTEYSQKLKEEREAHAREREELEAKTLSAEEKAKVDAERAQKAIEDGQIQLDKDKVTFEATKALEAANLSVAWAELVDFESLETIGEKIATINKRVEGDVQRQVTERLKALGIDPATTSTGDGGKPPSDGVPGEKNPWIKAEFNFTEQMRIMKEDPKKAERLAKLAGVINARA